MILLDLSQVLYSTIMAGMRDTTEIDEDFLRHIALNCIRSNFHKFKREYGSMVVATDAKHNWRKAVFPYYKMHRAKAKAKSPLDWARIHQIMDTIRSELKEYFPYPVIHVDGAEGDDVIGTLCFDNPKEHILIISADKDFGQLQTLPYIKQYDPIRKRNIEIDKPREFLKEHIIRGDTSDGIPNILSPDSVFTTAQHQGKMTQQRFDAFMAMEPKHYDPTPKRNFSRNEQLIDLTHTPVKLCLDILAEHRAQFDKPKGKLFQYMMDKNLRNLLQDIGDFT